MPLQSQQIVSLALQIAKCPGFTQQGGQFLNSMLQDLCQGYDLDAALGTFTFNFNSATGQGSGPYTLPADYLRTQVKDGKDEFFYTIQGVPYPLIQVTKAEYDWLVQTPGFQSFPYNYATDLSQIPAQLFIWPPSSGSYPATLRYYKLMPDIVAPETSPVVPWFLNTQVLIRGVAGMLMQLTGDDRIGEFLGDDEERYPLGVGTILKKYLKNVEDREGAVHTVGKDRRRWGRPFDQLKNTKNIGWSLAVMFLGAALYFGTCVEPAHANCTAPCTKAQVTTDINTNWPDNTAGLITPALLRSTVLDLVNSYLDTNGVASFTCPAGTPWLTAIATLSTYTCSGFPQTMPTSAAPGTPASANETIWFDSTDLRIHDKNASAVIGTTAVANAGSANNFFTAMSAAGVFSTAQPAFSNLSGQATLVQLPSIANNTFLGNISGSTSTPSALTPGQVGGALCVPNRQIFTSGTALTYTTPTCNGVTATWLEIDVQGGGASGSGSGTSLPSSTAGNASSFGALTANGGSATTTNSETGSAGGACSGSLGTQQNFPGSAGTSTSSIAANSAVGGAGGISYYGGYGAPGGTGAVGGAAPTNSGGGGAGGSSNSTAGVLAGAGGGAGCHIKTVITSSIAATYTYTVGASAAGGNAGTSGSNGGGGAAGLIDVVAHWQ